MVQETRPIETVDRNSGDLPLFAGLADVPVTRRRRAAHRFLNIIRLNAYIETILQRLPDLGVEAWLTSGCLVQTVWNVKTRQRPHAGIADYDLIYYDPDVSWEAEDAVIRRASQLFADLEIDVQVRNQARVPLWYRAKFNIAYPPVREAPHALRRYPSRTTAIAVTRRATGDVAFYAPFGFRDALTMQIRPNPRLPIPQVYASKAERWRAAWPQLVVHPWNDANAPRTGSAEADPPAEDAGATSGGPAPRFTSDVTKPAQWDLATR